MSNGSLWTLQPTNLELISKIPFVMDSKSSGRICGIRYSHDNYICAYWECSSMAIGLLVFDIEQESNLRFVKCVKAHFKPIVDIIFIPCNCKQNRMISIGEDRYLVEYDIENM